ncbi:MAG: SpoVR family protein [Acetobacteraceae bacterium]
MQTLCDRPCGVRHNHFFRNNHLFRQWTEPSAILDYLEFARTYVARCEDTYAWPRWSGCWTRRMPCRGTACTGIAEPGPLNLKTEERRERERREYDERMFNDLWRTLPAARAPAGSDPVGERRRRAGAAGGEPAPTSSRRPRRRLAPWQREIIRIVRLIAQYSTRSRR